MHSLQIAKDKVQDNLAEGSKCECCGQTAKLYRRRITGSMAVCLLAVHRKSHDYIHVAKYLRTVPQLKNIALGGGDFAKLRFWGLIEEKPGDRDDGCKHNGFFRITDTGISFVTGQLKIQSHILVYNNVLKSFDGDLINFTEAFGNKFNYDELMAGV